jgi:hypothetical protein
MIRKITTVTVVAVLAVGGVSFAGDTSYGGSTHHSPPPADIVYKKKLLCLKLVAYLNAHGFNIPTSFCDNIGSGGESSSD